MRDHPRVCGEQAVKHVAYWGRTGSPPRVRGTGVTAQWVSYPGWITPACAGNSKAPPRYLQTTLDHPRVCGEQGARCSFGAGCSGSPPRVRGTAVLALWESLNWRITPACAGNSARCWTVGVGAQDHPRVCGEQGSWLFRFFRSQGSPPRVRGTASVHRRKLQSRRITPACAGNREFLHVPAPPPLDHPRVCGEQAHRLHHAPGPLGSPPRVRGTD